MLRLVSDVYPKLIDKFSSRIEHPVKGLKFQNLL